MRRSLLLKFVLPLIIGLSVYHFYWYRISRLEIDQLLGEMESATTDAQTPSYVELLLSQKFTFLGSGGQSCAFLGEDGTTVLKLFKHYSKKGKNSLVKLFTSCELAYAHLREETGLLYLHIKKNTPLPVTLVDRCGFTHRVDINATAYALQRKADNFIFPLLQAQRGQNDIEGIKNTIHSLFQLIAARCSKGIGDSDTGLARNFAWIENNVFAIDIGTFFPNERLKIPLLTREEIIIKTRRLCAWIKAYYPELLDYYDQELAHF